MRKHPKIFYKIWSEPCTELSLHIKTRNKNKLTLLVNGKTMERGVTVFQMPWLVMFSWYHSVLDKCIWITFQSDSLGTAAGLTFDCGTALSSAYSSPTPLQSQGSLHTAVVVTQLKYLRYSPQHSATLPKLYQEGAFLAYTHANILRKQGGKTVLWAYQLFLKSKELISRVIKM